uniref:Uncharacterized protein n=1 Tax=Arundo donax TaxID=35708 RepID=A0A0A9A203_ARUDO
MMSQKQCRQATRLTSLGVESVGLWIS